MLYAHKITYPELAAAKVAVVTLEGEMIGGPDRRNETEAWKWKEWQHAVQSAARTPKAVPQNVMDYFQATKHLMRPPQPGDKALGGVGLLKNLLEAEDVLAVRAPHPLSGGKIPDGGIIIDDPMNNGGIIRPTTAFKPPRFTWSYSQLSTFLQCPARWAAEKYYKTVPYIESEAQKYGNLVHSALEHAVLGRATAAEQKLISDINAGKYVRALENVRSQGAEIHVEKEMCFTNKLKFCGWWDNSIVWYRGKADVLVVNRNKLTVWDYKTGAVKPDLLQLRMMCAFAALYFPQIEIFDGKLLFLAHDKIEGLERPLTRAELKPILTEVISIVRRMEAAWESETFPCRKSGLCRPNGRGYAGCGNKACPHAGA